MILLNNLIKEQNSPPFMFMMCGLPGSGKSTFAKTITVSKNHITLPPKIHSSDAIRKELYGDESLQIDHNKVFALLHKRIIEDLRAGRDVVYDATNINKKQRIHFLNKLKDINCVPYAIVMAVPFSDCLNRNNLRGRCVPEKAIKRMYMNWEPPHEGEGFHHVNYVFPDDVTYNNYTLGQFADDAKNFDQENKHHSMTLGEHCDNTAKYISQNKPDNFMLYVAAKLHDNGKIFTKTRVNRDGIYDGNCHYYQHQNTGSYDSMFYVKNITNQNAAKITYVANLIYYHMHPYIQWKQSERCVKRDKALLGDLYNDVLLLHEADVMAH